MLENLYNLISENPILLLFVVLSVGFLIGSLKIGSFQLGSVAGVLLSGLLFGHLGFKGLPAIETLGFVLFIFSVGYTAGPRFIQALKKDGRRYLAIAIIVSVTGLLLAAGLAKALNFEPGISAGMMAGSLTSTPTLAAADDAARSAEYTVPDNYTLEQVRTNITTSYAITYIFGLIGLILVIGFMPKLFGINLEKEAIKLKKEEEEDGKNQGSYTQSDIFVRAFRLENENAIGSTLKDVYARTEIQFTIQKIRRKGELFDPDMETILEQGDELSLVGIFDPEILKNISSDVIGPIVRDRELLRFTPETAKICITHKMPMGTQLGSLSIPMKYGSFVTRIVRLGVDIDVKPHTELERGDVLHVTGPAAGLESMKGKIGHIERTAEQTDLSTFSWSIVLGILVGTLTISLWGIKIGLGTAGGLLLLGISIGYLRSLFPVIGRMSEGASWIFTELGLLLFMAGVGLRGGSGLVETFMESGLLLLLAGIAITLIPLFIAFAYGYKIAKMNPLILLGAIVGAMTSGGALNVINNQSKSTIAGIGYTGAYAFANILLTIAGALIILLG
jgi:putative transport protein